MTVSRLRVLASCGGMVTLGGAERMVFEMLTAAQLAGAEVHCVMNDWASDEVAAEVKRRGFTGHFSAYRTRLEWRTADPRRWLAQLWDALKTNRRLLAIATTVRPTHLVVSSYDVVLRDWLALAILRLIGTTVVMKLCNAPSPGQGQRLLWRWPIRLVVSQFVSNSQFTHRELLACGIDPARVEHIPETAPPRLDGEAVDRDRRTVVYVGQVIPEKGLDLLIDAIAILRTRGCDVRLDVVGRIDGWISPAYGEYRPRLRARAAPLEAAGHVRFLGWREDVDRIMNAASVHCCPSLPGLRESFGLVVLEAKMAGIPSVVLPSGALPELVEHGVTGWVCRDVTAEALADGLQFFLDEQGWTSERAAAIRKSAEPYGIQLFHRRYQDLFARGAGEGATARSGDRVNSYEHPRHQRLSR